MHLRTRRGWRRDILTYLVLAVRIGLGCWMTFVHRLATHAPYSHRISTGHWWRPLSARAGR